ncbi:MAG: DUF4123 domain-containing protein, partial [Pseudomonadota bacterium]|nr:DUF4123 domain-containing protein [Pseudomonadota bacterium]
MPHSSFLTVLTGPNPGQEFCLPLNKTVTLGNGFESWLFLPHDQRLCGQHCSLHYDGEYIHLCDLNSQQGTFVHGINIAQLGPVPLPPGEQFSAGESSFQVHVKSPDPLAILREQSEPLLAIIDASRDRRILPLLTHSGAYYCSLFEGNRAQGLAAWAPYLVQLPKSSALLESLVNEGWGQHWGVYLTSLAPFETVLTHVRQWLWVQTEAGQKLFFRFYDPRTLRVFLLTLTVSEQQRFFGPVQRWLMEAENKGEVLIHEHQPSTLMAKPLRLFKKPVPLVIRQAQINQFEQAVYQRFERQAYVLLEKHLSPTPGRAIDPQWLRAWIKVGIGHAEQ